MILGGNLCLTKFKNDEGEEIGQVLYNSQLYGTFFGIYGVVEAEENGDLYIINSFKLKIVNYKGEINLGLVDAQFVANDVGGKPMGGTLAITVQGMHTTPNDELGVPSLVGEKISKQGASLTVERFLKPLHSNKEPLKNGVFDSEFHYREGKLISGKTERREFIAKTPPEKFQLATAASGWSCPFSFLWIF